MTEIENLNALILNAKSKQKLEFIELKSQLDIVYDSIKPINLIKDTWSEISTSNVIKGNILDSAIGLTTGYVSKKLLFGNSHNPIKNILGTVLEFAISNVTSKNTGILKALGSKVFAFIKEKTNK